MRLAGLLRMLLGQPAVPIVLANPALSSSGEILALSPELLADPPLPVEPAPPPRELGEEPVADGSTGSAPEAPPLISALLCDSESSDGAKSFS